MKKIISLFISLCIYQYVFSQITFEKPYYNPNEISYGSGTTVIADSNGYFISGSYYEKSNYKSVLIRTNLSGDTLWKKTFPNGYGNMQLMTKSNPKEYIFLSNPSNQITKQDVQVTKMDLSGNVIWNNKIVKKNWDIPNQIIETSDNGFLVVGQTNSLPGIYEPYSYDAYIIKLNSKGDTLWTKTSGIQSNDDYAYHAIETSDSHYLITGYEQGGWYDGKVLLIKMDTKGNILWKKKYGTQYINQAYSIAKTNDNNYIITGIRYSGITVVADVYVLKVDLEGNMLWEKTYHFSGNSGGSKLLVLDSGILIAGQSEGKIFLLKLGNDGNLLWSKTIITEGACSINSIDKCVDGGFIFTSPYSLTLFKTDSVGCIKPDALSVTGENNVSIHDNITFKVNEVRGENYTWVSNHGLIVSGQSTNNVVMNWDKGGLDTIKVFVYNSCGVDSTTFLVNIQECVQLNIGKIKNSGYVDFYVDKYEGKSPTYFWSVDNGVVVTGQNTNHIVVNWIEYGNLKVSVRATNDCSMIQDSIEFFYDKLNDVLEDNLMIFPNPAKDGVFNVTNKYNSKVWVQIYNSIGVNIGSDMLDNGTTKKYDLSVYGKGVFLIKVTGDNLALSKKIITH